jgi:hypothetical protein
MHFSIRAICQDQDFGHQDSEKSGYKLVGNAWVYKAG